MEGYAPAGEVCQLRGRTLVVAGLAQDVAAGGGDLVGADDQALPGVADGAGLGHGQPCDQIHGRLAGQGGFVDVGRNGLETDAQPCQQLLAER